MKTFKALGIIAISAVILFAALGCGNPGGGTNPGAGTNTGNGEPFALAGRMARAGGGEIIFRIAGVDAARSAARSVFGSEPIEISGKLQDNGIIYELKGTYDTETDKFIVSSGSPDMRFSITGAFNESGNLIGSNAIVAEKPGSEWDISGFIIEEKRSDEIAPQLTGAPNASPAVGLKGMLGVWKRSEFFAHGRDGKELYNEHHLLMGEWGIDLDIQKITGDGESGKENVKEQWSLISVDDKGSYFDVVVGYPNYEGTDLRNKIDSLKEFLGNPPVKNITMSEAITEMPKIKSLTIVVVDNSIIWVVPFSQSDTDKVTKYYFSNYLASYLNKNNIAVAKKYEKYKVELSNNGNRMTWTNYGIMQNDGYYHYVFDNAASAAGNNSRLASGWELRDFQKIFHRPGYEMRTASMPKANPEPVEAVADGDYVTLSSDPGTTIYYIAGKGLLLDPDTDTIISTGKVYASPGIQLDLSGSGPGEAFAIFAVATGTNMESSRILVVFYLSADIHEPGKP